MHSGVSLSVLSLFLSDPSTAPSFESLTKCTSSCFFSASKLSIVSDLIIENGLCHFHEACSALPLASEWDCTSFFIALAVVVLVFFLTLLLGLQSFLISLFAFLFYLWLSYILFFFFFFFWSAQNSACDSISRKPAWSFPLCISYVSTGY